MEKGHTCPHCTSKNAVWRGYRYNERTKKRMKLCRKCGRKFTPNDGFWRMRHSPEDIRKAVKLYLSGYSSAEVVLHMKRKYGINISRWTAITWARRYKKDV